MRRLGEAVQTRLNVLIEPNGHGRGHGAHLCFDVYMLSHRGDRREIPTSLNPRLLAPDPPGMRMKTWRQDSWPCGPSYGAEESASIHRCPARLGRARPFILSGWH